MSDLDDEFEAYLDGRLSAEEWVDRLMGWAVAACAGCARQVREHEAGREEARWVDPVRWPVPWVPLKVAESAAACGPQSREPGEVVRRSVERTLRPLRALAADQRVAKIERSWSVVDRPELVEPLLAAARDQFGDAPKEARV